MKKISELISIIKRDNKLSSDQIISVLSDAIANGKTEEDIYKEMYIDVYGYSINKEIAEEIVMHLPETGEHFSFQEAKEFESRLGMNINDVPACEFYLVLNNLYSDYHNTIGKYIGDPVIYAELTRDWFIDEDADTNKTFNYFFD